MARYTYIDGNLSRLAGVLNDSGYFDSVTYTGDPSYAISCTINGSTVYWHKGLGTSSDINQHYNIKVYGVTASFISNVTAQADNQRRAYYPVAVYECSGGIAIVCTNGRIVITKNQRGETTLAFNTTYTGTTPDGNMATIGTIAYTDTSTFANYKVNTNISSQTLLIPLCSCAAFDTESYTPTVLIAAYKQFTTVGFMVYNNKRYFFDGYFAIEDEEVAA